MKKNQVSMILDALVMMDWAQAGNSAPADDVVVRNGLAALGRYLSIESEPDPESKAGQLADVIRCAIEAYDNDLLGDVAERMHGAIDDYNDGDMGYPG